ncbi:MAG: hypothetical protein AB1489_22160 [Acidobacteriota bacterium]
MVGRMIEQIGLILKLQWTLFKNSLRWRTNLVELIARLVFIPILLLVDIGIGLGIAVLTYRFYGSEYELLIFSIVFSGVLVYWQLIPLLTTSFSERLNIARFRIFPISTGSLFILDLMIGFFDITALSTYLPMLGVLVGIALKSPMSLPIAAAFVLLFLIFNLACARYLQNLMEQFLASRRRKEIFVFLIFMLFFVPQAAYFLASGKGGLRRSSQLNSTDLNIYKQRVEIFLRYIAWTPPGVIARGLAGARKTLATQAGLCVIALVYAAAALGLAYRDLDNDFYGRPSWWQHLSIRFKSVKSPPTVSAQPLATPAHLTASISGTNVSNWRWPLLTSPRAAIIEKELKYFYRSPRTLMTLIGPVLASLVFILPLRAVNAKILSSEFILAGMSYYSLLAASQIFSNSFCFDWHGAKMYYLAPVLGRDVLIAKNLAASLIVAIQTLVLALGFHYVIAPLTLPILLNSLFVTLIGLLAMLIVGNYVSIFYPQSGDFIKLSGQKHSGLASMVNLAIMGGVFTLVALGPLCGYLLQSQWVIYLIFTLELIITAVLYYIFIGRAAETFQARAEQLLGRLISS